SSKADDTEARRVLLTWIGSPRQRWFDAPLSPFQSAAPVRNPVRGSARPSSLVSMDISASQTQIQAILLGDEDMEADAVLSREPHKLRLAKHVWNAHVAEDRPAVAEAELALALKMERRLFRAEAKRTRTDLVENHEAALRLIAEHEARI